MIAETLGFIAQRGDEISATLAHDVNGVASSITVRLGDVSVLLTPTQAHDLRHAIYRATWLAAPSGPNVRVVRSW